MIMSPQQQMALMQQLVTQQQLLAKAGVVVGGGQAQGHSYAYMSLSLCLFFSVVLMSRVSLRRLSGVCLPVEVFFLPSRVGLFSRDIVHDFIFVFSRASCSLSRMLSPKFSC
jgi:hypothetical protein